MFVIKFKFDKVVRYLVETQGNPEYNAIDSGNLEGAKKWKTERGALEYLKFKVLVGRQGEKLQARWKTIEVVEVSPQQQYHANNPSVIKQAKAKYDSKRPVFSFRPNSEILRLLERERETGETDAQLLNRMLGKLIISE